VLVLRAPFTRFHIQDLYLVSLVHLPDELPDLCPCDMMRFEQRRPQLAKLNRRIRRQTSEHVERRLLESTSMQRPVPRIGCGRRR
jgi:hypothetical protein